MRKNLQVIGYQPDTLCTRKDLEKFDMIWWASRPNPELTYVNRKNDFKLSVAAKEAFTRGIHLVNLVRKI